MVRHLYKTVAKSLKGALISKTIQLPKPEASGNQCIVGSVTKLWAART